MRGNMQKRPNGVQISHTPPNHRRTFIVLLFYLDVIRLNLFFVKFYISFFMQIFTSILRLYIIFCIIIRNYILYIILYIMRVSNLCTKCIIMQCRAICVKFMQLSNFTELRISCISCARELGCQILNSICSCKPLVKFSTQLGFIF